MRADLVVIALATPPGVAALYFLLAGEVSASEALAGAPVVLIASAFALFLAQSGKRELQVSVRGVVLLLRAFVAVVPDSWRVGRGLLQAVRRRPAAMQGVVTHVPFWVGGSERAEAGRRAAVVAAISLAPNGFAVGIDRERQELIVHQITPNPVRGAPDWPL